MPKGVHGSFSFCEVPECGRRMLARGLCSMHWQRMKKHGTTGSAEPMVRTYEAGARCSVDGCEEQPRGRGLCGTHWVRWKKYGDPTIVKQAPNGTGYISAHGYRVVTRNRHPLAASNGQVFEHRVILFDALGEDDQPCHWCGRKVSWRLSWPQDEAALVVDHLDGDKLNNALTNLVPSCNRCNHERAFS